MKYSGKILQKKTVKKLFTTDSFEEGPKELVCGIE
jgi:hypothetical protein